jgi:outer membrane protein TolC
VASAEERLSLTLREAALRAAQTSPNVQIARDNIHYWQAEVEAQRAPFVPVFKVDTGFRATSDPAISPYYDYYSPPDLIRGLSFQASTGIAGKLAFGTEFELKTGWNQSITDQRGTPLSPEYRFPIELSISQPLLKNLGSVNKRDLQAATIRRDQSSDEFRRASEDGVLAAAEAYVGLQAAQARLESHRASRDLAKSLAQGTSDLISNGRLPPTAIAPQAVLVSMREQDVLGAQVEVARARAALAFALDLPAGVELTASEPLAPVPHPLADGPVGDMAEAANPAVLAKARELELAQLDVSVQRNQALPDLRLRASAGTFGQSGTSQCSSGYYLDGVTPCQVPAQLNGGPGLAVANAFTARYGYVSVGAVFTIPLDPRPAARAQEAAEISLTRSERELGFLKHQVRLRAEEASVAVKALARELAEARKSVELANKALQFAREAHELGKSTVFDLIKAEELTTQTRDREIASAYGLALENVRLRAYAGELASGLLGAVPGP